VARGNWLPAGRVSTDGGGSPAFALAVTDGVGKMVTSKGKCRLPVTYTIPSATATGRGTAQAVGTVVVVGVCSAAGTGTAQVSATVQVAAGAGATGRGSVELLAFVLVAAQSTGTGRGSAACGAFVESLAASTATA